MLRKGTFILMKTKIQDMTSGSPGRLIILFAIPLMLGNICQQLYTMVDTMVVGQVAGVEALAALGAVDFLMWVVTGISTGLTQGFSIQLSQYYGAKDFENLRKSLAHSYRLTAFIAAGVLILSQSNLKELMAQDGDTLAVLRVEKRSRSQILLTGGADYRITAGNDESMCRQLKKRCFAVRTSEGDLFINCRKLRYKKMRFGAWYAPAVQLGKNIYFCAMPLGSVIGGTFAEEDDVKLGGNVGDALAASSLVTKRVCYELNGETGKIDFVGKEKMAQLLEKHPDWKKAYLTKDSQEAKHTFKYLQMLCGEQQKE